MKRFDLNAARELIASERAKTFSAGGLIAYNDPQQDRALVLEHADGRRARLSVKKASLVNHNRKKPTKQMVPAG